MPEPDVPAPQSILSGRRKDTMNMIAGLMFNFGLLGALVCVLIALVGAMLGGRLA